MGRFGGHSAVTYGILKLMMFRLTDGPDWTDTTIFKAPPEPIGHLQMTLLDEIQSEDCIDVLCNTTFKDI
jgi:hypothetical protein